MRGSISRVPAYGVGGCGFKSHRSHFLFLLGDPAETFFFSFPLLCPYPPLLQAAVQGNDGTLLPSSLNIDDPEVHRISLSLFPPPLLYPLPALLLPGALFPLPPLRTMMRHSIHSMLPSVGFLLGMALAPLACLTSSSLSSTLCSVPPSSQLPSAWWMVPSPLMPFTSSPSPFLSPPSSPLPLSAFAQLQLER